MRCCSLAYNLRWLLVAPRINFLILTDRSTWSGSYLPLHALSSGSRYKAFLWSLWAFSGLRTCTSAFPSAWNVPSSDYHILVFQFHITSSRSPSLNTVMHPAEFPSPHLAFVPSQQLVYLFVHLVIIHLPFLWWKFQKSKGLVLVHSCFSNAHHNSIWQREDAQQTPNEWFIEISSKTYV